MSRVAFPNAQFEGPRGMSRRGTGEAHQGVVACSTASSSASVRRCVPAE